MVVLHSKPSRNDCVCVVGGVGESYCQTDGAEKRESVEAGLVTVFVFLSSESTLILQ